MRKPILSVLGGVLVLAAAGQAVMLMDGVSRLAANAVPSEMMAGCTDVPEAVALADTLREQLLAWIVGYNLPGAAVPYVSRQRPKNEKAEAETRQVKAGAAEATDKAIRAVVKAAATFDDDAIAREYIVSFDITDQLSDKTIDALVATRHSFAGAAEEPDPFAAEAEAEGNPAFAAARLKKKV